MQSQKRKQAKEVFVPAKSINVKDPVWVQRPKNLQTGDHMGWIASRSSLMAQGYYRGQQQAWLLGPQVKAYPSQPKRYHHSKKQKARTRRNMKPPQARNQRNKTKTSYNAATMGASTSKSHATATQQVWVLKGQVPHIQGPFALLQARSLQTNQLKEYLAPRGLLQCQGYYAGCQQLWLPEDSHQNLACQSYIKEIAKKLDQR